MNSLTGERLTYLTEYMRQKMEDACPDEVFIQTDDSTFVWISTDEPEVVIVTLAPGKFEVEK